MPRLFSSLLFALAFLAAAPAFSQFPSTKDTVGPRGPGGLDVPDATPPAVPPTQAPKKVEEKVKKESTPPAPPASSGY